MQQTNSYQYRPPETTNDVGAHSKRKEILSTLAVFIIAPVIALLITAFVFQSYEVDGPSMEKTLQNKDRLLVTKTPRTWAKITSRAYIPHRYDIIIFNHTDNYGLGTTQKQLIKRVIGLPGDRVVVKDDIVKIYNREHPAGYMVDRYGPETSVISDTIGNIDQVVGQNEVFLMGDNRSNSLDSRAFGTVDAKDIVGKLSARIYPFSQITRF